MKILVIQVAYPGDIYLMRWIPKAIYKKYTKEVEIHCLVRKGCEEIVASPYVKKIFSIGKKLYQKILELPHLIWLIRRERYDLLINLHRYGSSKIITLLSGAKKKVSFNDFFSFLISDITVKHKIGDYTHEIKRNHDVICKGIQIPLIFYESRMGQGLRRIVIAPFSRLQTKNPLPAFWEFLLSRLSDYFRDYEITIIGGKEDINKIKIILPSPKKNIKNLVGKTTWTETEKIIKESLCVISVDSAPLHIASIFNIPTIAVYCSTSPLLGFYPLSSNFLIIEPQKTLECRPCGLTGKNKCPKEHFLCGTAFNLPHIWENIKNFINTLIY